MAVTVAVAQFAATLDKDENRAQVQRLVAEASSRGAELVVLPEYSMYFNPDVRADTSGEWERLDGPFVSTVTAAAAEHGITVVAGLTESLEESAKASNTVVVARPDGALEGAYRKVHLYDAFGYKESDWTRAATFEPLVFKVGDLAFGLMTCYDLRFPEIARALVDAGANALVVPAAWAAGPAKEDHWTTLARARAIENTSYVLASGQTGPHCTAQSMVIDPMGVVAASAGEAPGLAVTTISTDRLDAVRRRNPSLANRRFRVVTADS